MSEAPLPVVQGDWIARDAGGNFEVARVRQSYWVDGKLHADLVPYSLSGLCLKRVSPAEGGPTSFEPFCDISDWRRIEKPEFPLLRGEIGVPHPHREGWVTLVPTLFHSGYGAAKEKAFRTRPRKQSQDYARQRTRVVVVQAEPTNNADLEAAALRRAAQELRDQARWIGGAAGSALKSRAAQLEAEAAQIGQKL
jgi:hypothetical protein